MQRLTSPQRCQSPAAQVKTHCSLPKFWTSPVTTVSTLICSNSRSDSQCIRSAGTLIYVSFALHRARCGDFSLISSQSHHLSGCLSCSVGGAKVGRCHLTTLSLLSIGCSAHLTPEPHQPSTNTWTQNEDFGLRVYRSQDARNGMTQQHT